MGSISILSDSTCDLSPELIETYHISVFPLHIHLGEDSYSDGVDITPEDIYRWSDANKSTPKTSTLSPEEARDVLAPHVNAGNEVICFCISEEMSSCASVMRLAAMDLEAEDRVFVIDSRNLSTGIGHQIIEAAIMAQQGLPAPQIVANILNLQPYIRSSFVVDTLTYLHRGGRCSGLTALAGSALKLHPLISVVDGKMQPGKKYRGKMDRVIMDYIKDLEPALKNARPHRVFLTHSGCDEALIQSAKERLEALGHFEEIHITRAGSVITSHCGPGTLGILYVDSES